MPTVKQALPRDGSAQRRLGIDHIFNRAPTRKVRPKWLFS